jgi:hypothetical protein
MSLDKYLTASNVFVAFFILRWFYNKYVFLLFQIFSYQQCYELMFKHTFVILFNLIFSLCHIMEFNTIYLIKIFNYINLRLHIAWVIIFGFICLLISNLSNQLPYKYFPSPPFHFVTISWCHHLNRLDNFIYDTNHLIMSLFEIKYPFCFNSNLSPFEIN